MVRFKYWELLKILHVPKQSYPRVRTTFWWLTTFFFPLKYFLHGSWCKVDGWRWMRWMQILNVVTGADWMFYGHSLSWQHTSAYKSNSRENERTKTTLFQKDDCKNRLWHCIIQCIELFVSALNLHYFTWNNTHFTTWMIYDR